MAIGEAKKKKKHLEKLKVYIYIMQKCYQLMLSTPLNLISDENMIQKQHKTNDVQKNN